MLRVFRDPQEILDATAALRVSGKTIGFVPTMGALHEGHLALIREARAENDTVLVSIYVNPLQFGPAEDFTEYPRTFEADREACEREGVDLILHLRDEDMYPRGYATRVRVARLTETLCGASRPGHFEGVTTVVTKLFNLARPHRAYFGQKDAQQAVVIRRMAVDLNTGIDVRICPTVREPDGLALSSRNKYLSADERAQALALRRGLNATTEAYTAGERRVDVLVGLLSDEVRAQPLAHLDYAALVDPATVQPVERDDLADDAMYLLAVAAFVGKTRLIDNQLLPPGASL